MCPFCQDVALDSMGHHAVTCRHWENGVIRHNHLRDVFVGLCRQAHRSVGVEKGHGLTATPDQQMCSLLGGTGASLQLLMSK